MTTRPQDDSPTAADEFQLLLAACQRGDGAAADELVRSYLPHVRAAVRRQLPARLRARFDSLDFAQAVWLSFFRAALGRRELANERALIAYLCQMARLKVVEEFRHQTTQKVGLTRDVPLEPDRAAGREPTPSAVAVAADEWHRLTAGLPDRERSMLRMLRDGHTHAEAAAAFGLSEKTVQRLVHRVLGRTSPGVAP